MALTYLAQLPKMQKEGEELGRSKRCGPFTVERSRRRAMMKVTAVALLQVVALLSVAGGAALAFNAWRPDAKQHIDLRRDYFPKKRTPPPGKKETKLKPPGTVAEQLPAPAGSGSSGGNPVKAPNDSGSEAPAAEASTDDASAAGAAQEDAVAPPEHGFRSVTFEQALEIYNDPGYAQGICIFVDARDDEHFREGHIPGAHQLDHYRSEHYLPQLVPIAMGCDRVVVYCNGGECEDSIFACTDLLDAGVPHEQIYLYEGGYNEWKARGGPLKGGSE